MSPDNRYDVSGLIDAQFEPGSDGLALKNLLGIASPAEMDIAEANALVVAVDHPRYRSRIVFEVGILRRNRLRHPSPNF